MRCPYRPAWYLQSHYHAAQSAEVLSKPPRTERTGPAYTIWAVPVELIEFPRPKGGGWTSDRLGGGGVGVEGVNGRMKGV